MSVESENYEKMIKTCQEILNACEKPFVWEEEGIYEYGNFKKPFNLFLPHPQIDRELQDLFEKFSGSSYLYDQVKAICTLDEEWIEYGTYGLDRDFNCTFSKYTLKPEYAEQIKTYFNQRLHELLQSTPEETINVLATEHGNK
ncbi:nitrite reductase [Desulfosporosinus sp. PR]|uniref:nitrite reductase n=1 Tax=Candidatus Desulfosporosinus nitrosoreducens TaxID=3401928 RepID=UPI0027F97EEB|nr:nitrite reductase [Desulfosporosinus sp. PR]MDQ7093198.1 nitrite reductase [Desulfosporosinus sp. PR]